MTKQKIYFAADHAGLALKQYLLEQISFQHYDFQAIDLGVYTTDAADYPDIANLLAKQLANNELGVLICGTGIGISIAANRHHHLRAALCHSVEYARLAREHNNANVLVLGGRYIEAKLAEEVLSTFLSTPFAHGRHASRVAKLS